MNRTIIGLSAAALLCILSTASGQYFGIQTSQVIQNRLGASPLRLQIGRNADGKCPVVSQKSPYECGGQTSTCWSPGVRDTDCPSHGLCCFNGCVNICQGPSPPPVSPARTPRPRPKNPCSPSPCGPGTTCTPSPSGNPICRCKSGLIPNPDTITGCKPECVRDPDCQYGYVCQNQRCVEKPDPCNPSPCGPGATCSANSIGNPICRCEPGLIPKPDTITGCGPECVVDPDCQSGYVCDNQKCIEKPDPCDPSPCGPGADCMVNSYGNPICRCQPGLVPKPDTITGCGPECVRDPDCDYGFVCDNQKCIEKPDPCDPSPCGPGANCMVNSLGNPVCRCQEGLIPNPDTITGCKPECVRDPDCDYGYVCENQRCVEKPDPCDPSPCGPGAHCMVDPSGNAICRCDEGLVPKPDTITGCGPECVVDPDCQTGYICQDQRCIEKPDPCNPSPCGPGTMCMANKFGNPICRCLGKLVPKPDTITGCGPECTRDPDCEPLYGRGFVCEDQICVEAPDPCDPNPCGPGAEASSSGPGTTCQCTCPSGFLGDPYQKCIQGECQIDDECPLTEACEDYYCKNPCKPDTCQKEYFCKVIRHIPTCGLQYVPEEPEPRDNFVIGESYSPGSRSSGSSGHVVGGAFQGRTSSPRGGSGNPFVIGSRGGSRDTGSSHHSSSGRTTSGSGSPRSIYTIGAASTSRYQRKKRELLRRLPFFFQ